MNRYPAQQTAEQLARHGRYGDSVLVHMNPAEVQGIAALSPTGKLTRNPVTGQPEAFLPFLAPLLGSWLGSTLGGAALTGALGVSAGVGSAIAGGIGSGLATAAITGDLKRGLVSGIMGAGLGAAFGAAGDSAAQAAGSVAGDTATEAAAEMTAQQAAAQFGEESILANAGNAMQPGVLTQGAPTAMDASLGMGSYSGMPGAVEPGMANMSATDRMFAPFQEGSGLFKELTKARTTLPFALGAGQIAEWDQQDLLEEGNEARRRKNAAKRQRAMMNLQRGYGAAQPYGFDGGGSTDDAIPSGMTPEQWAAIQAYLGINSSGTTDPVAVQRNLRGPYKKAPPSDYRHGFNAEFDWFQHDPDVTEVPDYGTGAFAWSLPYYQNYASPINRFAYGTPDFWWPEPSGNRPYFDSLIGNDIGYQPPGSLPSRNADYWARVRGSTPTGGGGPDGGEPDGGEPDGSGVLGFDPSLYPPGSFDNSNVPPNFNYKLYIEYWDLAPDWRIPTAPGGGNNDDGKGGVPGNVRPHSAGSGVNAAYANGIMPFMASRATQMMAAGGPVIPTPFGEAPVSGGGVADVGREIGLQQIQKPAPDEVQMVVAAISGQMGQQGTRVIELFIQKYGVNMFRAIRQKVLQMIQPGAQIEGMVRGAGGGMDDQVMGTIGNQRPVAVSPGEYIVPADVVSGLGDGSSDSGAAELDQMSQRVRRARGGSIEQPPPLNARRFMPI